MKIDEKIKTLEEQAEQAKTLWTKCQGAIEILTSLKAEEEAEGNEEKELATEEEA